MKLSIDDLRNDRQWRSATGLDQKRFTKLVLLVESSYKTLFGKTIQHRQAECPDEPHLCTYTDLLFFTLFSLKSGLTYDLLGVVAGLDGSTAKRLQVVGVSVLQHTLTQAGYAPKRRFQSVEEFKMYFQKHHTLIIDGTDQRTQRPAHSEYQKQIRAAGAVQRQKKAHTVKSMIITTPDRYIQYVSRCWVGKSHDYRMLKHEFPLKKGGLPATGYGWI